jgi:hypothetical protein
MIEPQSYFDLRLAVVRLAEDFRAVVRFLGLRAAVVRLRVVRLRAGRFRAVVRFAVVRLRLVPFRLRVAAAFFAARDLTADFRFRVAAAFFAAVDRFREVVRFRVVDFLRDVDFLRVVAMVTSSPRSGRHALQASPLPLAHASPHAVPLVSAQRVVEALDPDRALRADALRLARRSAFLGEENFRVELPASRPLLPRDVVVHATGSPARELQSCNSEAGAPRLSSPNDELFVSRFEGVVDNSRA